MEACVYFEYVNFFDLEGRQKLHSGHRKIMPHYISTKSKGIILIMDEREDLSKDTFLINVKHRYITMGKVFCRTTSEVIIMIINMAYLS